MELKNFYQEIINKGIEADVRTKKGIEEVLQAGKESFSKLTEEEKKFFDRDQLINPYSDTRILNGSGSDKVSSIIVGIDVDVAELLLVDRLNQKGNSIDLVVSHHPAGRAYAQFYDVMDLQVDIFRSQGINLSLAEKLLETRQAEVSRRVSSANHQRPVDAAKLLGINFLCMHTPCDNLAYRFIIETVIKKKPKTLAEIMNHLMAIDEYQNAALNNNPPKIVSGSPASRCSNIHVEFTGGTEGPKDIYERLSLCGVDTIISMHQSEEHFKLCLERKLNVIFASHIASDNLGVNLMLDHLESQGKFVIQEFSGFWRHNRNK